MLKSFRNKIQSLNKTQQGILTAILVLINIGIVIFWISIWVLFQKEKLPPEEIIREETEEERQLREIETQLRELEGLRKETPPLTEEEVKSQVKEMEKLRHETQPLSQEEIQKQLEELEKLR